MLRRIVVFLRNESGSASIEFVALAIPLFIPIFIFLNNYAADSAYQDLARTLARESVRTFVLADHEEKASAVAEETAIAMAIEKGYDLKRVQDFSLRFECSESPCLTPRGRVRAHIELRSKSGELIKASAQEYVSAWR